MTAQLLKAKSGGAQAILIWGIGPELAAVANGMAKLGMKEPLIGGWTLSMSNYIDNAGSERQRHADAADLHRGAHHAAGQEVHRGLPQGIQRDAHPIAGIGGPGV